MAINVSSSGVVNSSGTNSISNSSVNIYGDNRVLIVLVCWSGAVSINDCSYAETPMSSVSGPQNIVGDIYYEIFHYNDAAAGENQTVTCNFSGSFNQCSMHYLSFEGVNIESGVSPLTDQTSSTNGSDDEVSTSEPEDDEYQGIFIWSWAYDAEEVSSSLSVDNSTSRTSESFSDGTYYFRGSINTRIETGQEIGAGGIFVTSLDGGSSPLDVDGIGVIAYGIRPAPVATPYFAQSFVIM